MKKLKFTLFIALILITFSSFMILEWYVYEASNFKISFPQKSIEETKKMNTNAGEIEVLTLVLTAKSSSEKNLKYYFSATKLPSDNLSAQEQKTFLDAAAKGSLRNHNATLISEKSIKLDKYSGKEIKMSIKDGEILATMKSYIVRDNIYGLIVYTFKRNDMNDEIDNFFDSFVIK